MRSLFPLSLCSALLVQAPDGARAEVPEFFVGPQIITLGFGDEVGDRPLLGRRAGAGSKHLENVPISMTFGVRAA